MCSHAETCQNPRMTFPPNYLPICTELVFHANCLYIYDNLITGGNQPIGIGSDVFPLHFKKGIKIINNFTLLIGFLLEHICM